MVTGNHFGVAVDVGITGEARPSGRIALLIVLLPSLALVSRRLDGDRGEAHHSTG